MNVHSQDVEGCRDVSLRFAYYVDHFEYDRLIDLFTEDGVLDRRGVDVVAGRGAIMETMKKRDPKMRTRHVCTNVLIDLSGERDATGVTYFTLYRGKEEDSDQTLELTGPAFVGEYHDAFRKTKDGWKIARRRVQLIFQREPV
jgi:ketosteroid isomerase-like protein